MCSLFQHTPQELLAAQVAHSQVILVFPKLRIDNGRPPNSFLSVSMKELRRNQVLFLNKIFKGTVWSNKSNRTFIGTFKEIEKNFDVK